MNGNANLNANNLTPQNVTDWREKLGIADAPDLTNYAKKDASNLDSANVTSWKSKLDIDDIQTQTNEIAQNITNLQSQVNVNSQNISNNTNSISSLQTNLNNKVDKVDGKGLSTNDFTDADKTKLDSLSNYDDTDLKNRVSQNENDISTNQQYIETLTNEIITTNQNVEDNANDITQNKTNITNLQSGLSNTNTNLLNLTTRVNANEILIGVVDEKVDNLETSTNTSIASLTTKVNNNENNINSLSTQLATQDTKINNKVDKTFTLNSKEMSGTGITLFASDVSALPSSTKYGKSLSVSGKNVSLKDQDGNTLSTIATQDTTYSNATQSANGLMSSADKTKLDGISANVDSEIDALIQLVDNNIDATTTNSSNIQDLYTRLNTTNNDVSSVSARVTQNANDITSLENTKADRSEIPQGSILYSTTGQNTNGAMTQKATTDALNTKPDKTLMNIATESYVDNQVVNAPDVVISYYYGSDGWYRLYKSGWLECGGSVTSSTSGTQTKTLPGGISFEDTNYTLIAHMNAYDSGNKAYAQAWQLSRSSFGYCAQVNSSTIFYAWRIDWVAYGKALL